ncbi:MAG: hypothetical protein COC01_06800 [Bacteroidetes bacterium]|nr:MAG: hypothetical protein COC01_06800 [Bacteroidota bacterium]
MFDHLNNKPKDFGKYLKNKLRKTHFHFMEVDIDYFVRIDELSFFVIADCQYNSNKYDLNLIFPYLIIEKMICDLILLDEPLAKELKQKCLIQYNGYDEIAYDKSKMLNVMIEASLDLENEAEYDGFLPLKVNMIEAFSVQPYEPLKY